MARLIVICLCILFIGFLGKHFISQILPKFIAYVHTNFKKNKHIHCTNKGVDGGCPRGHTVQSGETCWSVAKTCGISLGTLYHHNGLLGNGDNCDYLQVGQFLCCTHWNSR